MSASARDACSMHIMRGAETNRDASLPRVHRRRDRSTSVLLLMRLIDCLLVDDYPRKSEDVGGKSLFELQGSTGQPAPTRCLPLDRLPLPLLKSLVLCPL